AARRPLSAMKRYSSPFFRRSTPSFTDGAVQNCFSTILPERFRARWSQSLVNMMNHEPRDMITRTVRVPRLTMLPFTHSGIRPYGLAVLVAAAATAAVAVSIIFLVY